MQVLSFYSTILTFLKNSCYYSDPFIPGQQAVCTIGGLTGTFLFPVLSKKHWAASSQFGYVMISMGLKLMITIRYKFCCLIPVFLYIGTNLSNENYSAWNAAMLFGGQDLC